MEWISDPTVWVGLATLVVLEIVLGIDNLVFIAILAGRLPERQRDRARVIGLSLALIMRLALLAAIGWVVSLKDPVIEFWRFALSWRDLILIAGGLFLLVKATTEIHERVGGQAHEHAGDGANAAFWPIVAQIIVLDLVFSLDSVITAVGMVDEVEVMMAAVVIAVGMMLFASKPLTAFITARPSLIILCLGFLLMIGLVLVLDGFGWHVPKGYVYAAIGFSVLIEVLNQLAARGRRKSVPQDARQQVADAVLRILGGVPLASHALPEGRIFGAAERQMVGGVLGLGDLRVSAIMTPRERVAWVDGGDPDLLGTLRASPHRYFPVGRGSLDAIEGVVRKEDVLSQLIAGNVHDLKGVLRAVPSVPAGASVLDVLARSKRSTAELALVVDDEGRLLGIVTRNDLLEAIAGEFPDEGE